MEKINANHFTSKPANALTTEDYLLTSSCLSASGLGCLGGLCYLKNMDALFWFKCTIFMVILAIIIVLINQVLWKLEHLSHWTISLVLSYIGGIIGIYLSL